ncbi:MAG: YtxH domain-containing protein [Bacteroidetes bacterium]|nr:YtxH domain-containing protein [Bacteroidota bacterium]
MMDNKKLVAGLLAGVAAGAVLSLLFTEKGKKIRKKWYKQGNQAAEGLKEKFSDFVDKMEEKLTAKR